jgi:hypothetical protein
MGGSQLAFHCRELYTCPSEAVIVKTTVLSAGVTYPLASRKEIVYVPADNVTAVPDVCHPGTPEICHFAPFVTAPAGVIVRV